MNNPEHGLPSCTFYLQSLLAFLDCYVFQVTDNGYGPLNVSFFQSLLIDLLSRVGTRFLYTFRALLVVRFGQ